MSEHSTSITAFDQLDKRVVDAVEITSVSPSFDDLVVLHERAAFEQRIWLTFLQTVQTPIDRHAPLGHTYVSAYRLVGSSDWVRPAIPQASNNPSIATQIQTQLAQVTQTLSDQQAILLGQVADVSGHSDLQRINDALEMLERLRELVSQQDGSGSQ